MVTSKGLGFRKNSIGFCGGAYGDEGKGRIVDEYVHTFLAKYRVLVYRDNGGANAGHTITLADGTRIAMHQLPSGIFCQKAELVLGGGMVIHPDDLLFEIEEAKRASRGKMATIMLDEMAILSLDTHRAMENTLKKWQEGGRGATGRGISPAYADVLLRHPLRVRDITHFNEVKVRDHYRLYTALIKGMGEKLASVLVSHLRTQEPVAVGSEAAFMAALRKQGKLLLQYARDVYPYLEGVWKNPRYAVIFEKSQAVGLDYRWGVYPDITASDTTFAGIYAATQGVINPTEIAERCGVIKATYMSSVGTRQLPTVMEERFAKRIREDAHEYGATTKRPRDIYYLDLPALTYFARVGAMNTHVLTHMDIVYPDMPIKVCVGYKRNGKTVGYRPDQVYLKTVKPVYKLFKPWDSEAIKRAKKASQIPKEAQVFIRFVEKSLRTKISMITVGPKRDQSIVLR